MSYTDVIKDIENFCIIENTRADSVVTSSGCIRWLFSHPVKNAEYKPGNFFMRANAVFAGLSMLRGRGHAGHLVMPLGRAQHDDFKRLHRDEGPSVARHSS